MIQFFCKREKRDWKKINEFVCLNVLVLHTISPEIDALSKIRPRYRLFIYFTFTFAVDETLAGREVECEEE